MKDKLIFPSQVYILGIWTADLALTSTEVLVSCLLMLMCLCLEMNGAVTEIYLYSRVYGSATRSRTLHFSKMSTSICYRKSANDTLFLFRVLYVRYSQATNN